jgi:diguanylate cyclase (GGDEF)-like protein
MPPTTALASGARAPDAPFVPFPSRHLPATLEPMSSPNRAPIERLAAAVLRGAALALPLAALGALRTSEPLMVSGTGPGWLGPIVELAGGGIVAACALALLAGGLGRGSVSLIAWSAGLTAVAGGLAASGLGQPIAGAGALAGGALLLAGSAVRRMADRRLPAGLGVAVLLFGAVAATLLGSMVLPAEELAGIHLPAGLAGAALAVGATTLAGGRAAWMGPALVAVGSASLALARPDTIDTLIPPTTLAAGALAMVAWPGPRPLAIGRVEAASPHHRLPDLTGQLADGALLFDGSLRLRDWNAAAATLLDLGPDQRGLHLEQLLGTSLGALQRRDPAVELHATRRAPGGAPLELMLVPLDGEILVLARDPAGAAERREQLDRLTRELRGTIEELMHARRTIELQREELERAATIDPLTGVASRSSILERLRVEVAQARRYAHPVAIALVDIDGFAAINREHGLEVGDAVLREAALRLRLRIREADALGRSAGDAFLAILPHTDEAGAATFADALRHRLGQRPIATAHGELPITASIGVAVIRPGEELDTDGLLARADEALGSARAGGGDRIALDRLHGLARLDRARDDAEDRSADDAG